MSKQEIRKADVLRRLERGQITQSEAGKILRLSTRQIRRLAKRLSEGGTKGLIHRGRGVASKQATAVAVKEAVLRLGRTKYAGFNDRHLTEKLCEEEKLDVSRETVRRLLRGAGVGSPRKRRRKKHRSRRERKPHAGMMMLWDGSRHDWLEGRGPVLSLMGAVDDATGEMLPGAQFYLQEGAEGYLRILYETALEKGLPQSAYGDKHSSLCRNDDKWSLEEELRGEQELTQVGCAMRALCINKLDAHSPQAKGRIERPWGTFQDRLVSELRLAGATSIEQANDVLRRFRPQYNKRFAIKPREPLSAWRPVPKAVDLKRLCSFRYDAVVKNDNTVQHARRVIQIPPGPKGRSYAKAHVELCQLLDGSWRVYFEDALIAEATNTPLEELRALPKRKRSASSRAFRKAVLAA